MDLIDRLWQDSPLFLARDEFAKTLEGWTLEPVEHDGEVVGVVVVNGPRFHFAKFTPEFQVGRSILRKYPGELVARHGFAETSTPKDDTRQQRFNERLGFRKVGEDAFDIHYRITELRGSQCQSSQ
jgi:hypothetical protein